MAAVTPVRDPGVYSTKIKQWPTSDHAMDTTYQQAPAASPTFKSKPGRFSHGHHKSRRNTSPSIGDKLTKRKPRIDVAFLGSCRNNEEMALRTIVQQKLTADTVNQQDDSGKTGLNYVCSHGNIDMLKILCTVPHIDANLADKEGNTPLMIAAQAGLIDILSTLLKHYKDSLIVDQRNIMGFTALMKASLQGRTKCVKFLLQAGASPWLTDYGRGFYALQWAKYCGRHSCAEVIERFLKSSNQKQPPAAIRKKNFKQKNLGGKSSSEPDLINLVKQEAASSNNNNVPETVGGTVIIGTEPNFNQCPVENSNLHDQKGWLKRGLKKAFTRKSADMKVVGSITGVGMIAAASGGIISNTGASSQASSADSGKNEDKSPSRVIPRVHVTNSNSVY